MKKITLIFVVSDEVADDIKNELAFGNMENVAFILNENCEETNCNIEEYEG